MILGNVMQIFEDVLYEKDEHVIIGFINTQHELEYTIYKALDGGSFPLEDIACSKKEFSDLLESELNNFMNSYISITIIGHAIRIVTSNGIFVKANDLDEEVYNINQSILDGNDCGDVFIESIKEKASWKIVR